MPGLVHDGLAERRALLHPPGELVGRAILESVEVDRAQQVVDSIAIRGHVEPAELELKLDVSPHAAPRHERAVLEHDADIGARRVDDLAVDEDLPVGAIEQPGNQEQKRGLAAPRRAEERDEFAGRDAEIGGSERVHLVVTGAEELADRPDLDGRARCGNRRHSAPLRPDRSPLMRPVGMTTE